MKILTFSTFYFPGYKGGGPIKTISNLFSYGEKNMEYYLLTSDRDLGDSQEYSSVECGAWNALDNVDVFYVQTGLKGYKQIFNILRKSDYDLIYINSFFSFRFSIYPQLLAMFMKQKIVLGPRGEFSDGALRLKPIRKKVFISVYKLIGLHYGTVFQASSKFEAEDIRKALGPKVDIQLAEDIGSQDFAKTVITRSSNALKGVFVSRISPMKNLLWALKTLKSCKDSVVYHIYGPIEDHKYWGECERVINDLPQHIQVEYKGELKPDQVILVMAKYDFFFMPTMGENYGHAIVEALCSGLPILISDATPWRDLQEKGIGWDLPLYNQDLFNFAIHQLALMTIEEHYQMRKHILLWARQMFSQPDSIEANLNMFRYAYDKRNDN